MHDIIEEYIKFFQCVLIIDKLKILFLNPNIFNLDLVGCKRYKVTSKGYNFFKDYIGLVFFIFPKEAKKSDEFIHSHICFFWKNYHGEYLDLNLTEAVRLNSAFVDMLNDVYPEGNFYKDKTYNNQYAGNIVS